MPARVVVGLVYADSLGGFGFHLWNEVHVNRRWVAVDATYHQTEVDVVHIKLAKSSLDGVAPFEALLPVARVLGKMTICRSRSAEAGERLVCVNRSVTAH